MNVNVDAIKTAIGAFRKEHKCKRVFLPDDEGFAQKYFSFRRSALSRFGGEEAGEALSLKDDILWSEGDKPKTVEISKSDVIAVFDNTKIGFFGNVAKSECDLGALVTTKGFVTLNDHTEGLPDPSGFLAWRAFLVGNQAGLEYGVGANVYLYTDSDEKDGYPKGPGKAFHFGQSKLEDSDLYPLLRELKAIVKRTLGENIES